MFSVGADILSACEKTAEIKGYARLARWLCTSCGFYEWMQALIRIVTEKAVDQIGHVAEI